MRKTVELNIKGIKCDHCDYKNENVPFENYDSWLNKPCPECGENLLTEPDFNNLKVLIKIAEMTNEMFPSGFDGDDSKVPEFDKKLKGIVEMNGTGRMNFKIES